MSLPFDPAQLCTAGDVSSALVRCFGRDPAQDLGMIHSAAIWEGPHGPRSLRIGEHAPASAVDYFLLHAARARANAMVTTGRILREEPSLRYDLGASSPFGEALQAYRRESVGIAERARVIVLSTGIDVPFAHPAFHGWAEPVLFVPDEAPRSVDDLARFHGITLRRFPHLSLDIALDALRRDGARTTLVEAGTSTTRALYDDRRGFDELILTRFLDAGIDARAIGGAFPDRATLEQIHGAPASETAYTEPSGAWSVSRYRAA